MCEMGLENCTRGVGIVDHQGNQSIKVYRGIAPALHTLSIAGLGRCFFFFFSGTSQIVNILVFAVHKVSLRVTQHCSGSSETARDNAQTNGHGRVPVNFIY